MRTHRLDFTILAVLATASMLIALLAMRSYRAAGVEPSFYQQNFAPAVMIACGRGFVMPEPAPAALLDFLALRRDTFACGELPADLTTTRVQWNAAWVYLYRAAAAVWRVTGVSWSSLDWLLALMSGIVTASLYGLFRLTARPHWAAGLALLLTISPGNLTHLLSLRDYSKAPFALTAIALLAFLVARPVSHRVTVLLSAAFGVTIGIGWGFRGDFVIMAPLGMVVVLACLPAPIRWRALAAGAMAAGFVIASAPVIAGLSSSGACQFHLALLGLTTPVVNELGIAPAPYQFADQFLDASIAARVTDYSSRVLNAPATVLCSPAYEAASSRLYMTLAATFPADLLAHAYGSALSIFRGGLELSAPAQAPRPFAGAGWIRAGFDAMGRGSGALSPVGPLLFLGAVGALWVRSRRLALGFAVVALFLASYPAIEFEERHWFHLRFMPWFALSICAAAGVRSWKAPDWIAAVAAPAVLVAALVAMLVVVRALQTRFLGDLIAQYRQAAVEALPIVHEGAFVRVDWPPDRMHFASDLLAVTLDAAACGGTSSFAISARYEFAAAAHDLSSSMTVTRPVTGSAPSLFLPAFFVPAGDRTTLARFTGLEVTGAPAPCVAQVARVVDRAAIPLWMQFQIPAGASPPLYHTLRRPRLLRW